MNSLKSFCSFTERRVVTVDDLEEEVDPLLWRQRRVVPRVVHVRLLERVEYAGDAIHDMSLS